MREEAGQATRVQEDNRFLTPELAAPDQIEHTGEGLSGVDRVEDDPFLPGQALDGSDRLL